MILTPSDLDILRAVHRHRLLRSRHLVALLGRSPQTILRRLQLLFHHSYLDRPPMQLDWYARSSEPMVYAMGKSGAAVLKEDATRGGMRWDRKNRSLSRAFLHHTLMVAEIMVAFEIACRSHEGVRLIPPEEVLAEAPESTQRLRLPFRWQVGVHHGGKLHRLGVEPDRLFGLEFDAAPESRRRAYFFLEADRGTMPVVRQGLALTSFLRKLLSYRETWRQGLHRTHLGIPNFRVLTVTTSPERVKHLVEACRSVPGGGSRLFLFTHGIELRCNDILTRSWLDAQAEVVRLLVSPNPRTEPKQFRPISA